MTATLDAARDLAVHRGLATDCAWYLCTHVGGGVSAWLYVDLAEVDGEPIEEVCLVDTVDIYDTAEEAAEALLEWAEHHVPEIATDLSWS